MKDVEVVAHGLAAAPATVIALMTAGICRTANVTLTTLGGPKVGNSVFARAFARRTNLRAYRLVAPLDLIPSLPPYRHEHVGDTWRFEGNAWVKAKRPAAVSMRCQGLDDHALNLYSLRLQVFTAAQDSDSDSD